MDYKNQTAIDYELETFRQRFEFIEQIISKSSILDRAEESFLKGLKSYEVTAYEKSLAFADFSAKVAMQIITTSSDVALKLGVAMAQEQGAKDDNYLNENLKQEQIAKTIAEKNLVKSQDKLVSAQQAQLAIQVETAKAENEIKNLQILLTYAQLLQELVRTEVLPETALQNLKIKKRELFMEWYKTATSKDTSVVLGKNIHEMMLNEVDTLDSDTSKLNSFMPIYKELLASLKTPKRYEIDGSLLNIKQDTKPTYTLLVSNATPKVNEEIKIVIVADDTYEHDVSIVIDDSEVYNATSIVKTFDKQGEYEIKAVVRNKDGNTINEYTKTKIIKVI